MFSDVLFPTLNMEVALRDFKILGCFTLGDGTGSLSRNAGNKLRSKWQPDV
jgi:hypothetical protein